MDGCDFHHRRIGVIPPKVAGLIVDWMGALHEGDDQLKMAEISIFAGPLQVFNSRDSLKCLRKQRGLGSS